MINSLLNLLKCSHISVVLSEVMFNNKLSCELFFSVTTLSESSGFMQYFH